MQVDQVLFEEITQSIIDKGYFVKQNALPDEIALPLREHILALSSVDFKQAGIGRQAEHSQNPDVRSDAIHWITDEYDAGMNWLRWATSLQEYINRTLYLGLFSFESHFAHYPPGAFYQKHLDAFRGQSNRRLSLVTYLNPNWQASDGGELLIYDTAGKDIVERVKPELGTVVVFLSEEYPHEVLAAKQERYSIAGWFRVNNSLGGRIDPPS